MNFLHNLLSREAIERYLLVTRIGVASGSRTKRLSRLSQTIYKSREPVGIEQAG